MTEAKDKTDRREIKFRAWDKSGKQMVSPDYITRDGCGFWQENSIPTMSKILMQYTGLKDKNGKEIYEGDIVNSPEPYGAFGAVVYWTSGYFIDSDEMYDLYDNLYGLEILGNIYENPELLKP